VYTSPRRRWAERGTRLQAPRAPNAHERRPETPQQLDQYVGAARDRADETPEPNERRADHLIPVSRQFAVSPAAH
jgi:hypothetical protein